MNKTNKVDSIANQISSFDLLEVAKCFTMSPEDLLENIEKMKNKEILQQHPYAISLGSDNRHRTYLPDETKASGRRMIAKATLESLHDAIITDYKERKDREDTRNMNLENVYKKWLIWRREIGTDPNTIKADFYTWNRFLKEHSLSTYRVCDITVTDLEDFYNSITENHVITFKMLSNVRSVLSGIFKYAVRLGSIHRSIVFDVDYRQYHTRCKPSGSKKETYTDVERIAIYEFLEGETDIYSLAIAFAFRNCLRIGELSVIKKADVLHDKLLVERSIRQRQRLNDDFTFSGIYYDVEGRIKGNAKAGIRAVNLTPKAREIALKAMSLHPDGEYLFMRDGKPIYAATFNDKLKKVCNKLGIKYRSSHQIRFTTATNLSKAGIPINEISYNLGHCDVKQTFNYIRQQEMSEQSKALANQVLDM